MCIYAGEIRDLAKTDWEIEYADTLRSIGCALCNLELSQVKEWLTIGEQALVPGTPAKSAARKLIDLLHEEEQS